MFVSPWVHRYAVFTAVMTFFLLLAGALVTSTGSGLSVPDWPLSYGQWMPPMVGGVFYEHGHRMVAGFVGFLTLGLAIALKFSEKRRWVRWLGFFALAAVVVQAVLGGMTVLFGLPPQVSVSHAILAQTFFAITILLVLVTSSSWQKPQVPIVSERFLGLSLVSHAGILVGLFYLQLFFGATMRHWGAGLAVPDFPTVFGGWLPPSWSFAITVHLAHRLGAVLIVLGVGTFAYRVLNRHSSRFGLVAAAGGLIGIVLVQFMLGAFLIWAQRPVPLTTLHLGIGAVCLAISVATLAWLLRVGETEVTRE